MSYLVCNSEKQSPLCTVENVPLQAPSWWFHPQNQTGTWCESPSHSCKREEEYVDKRLQQRVYQLTSTTCEPGNGNSHHCLHYRFAVLKLHGFLPFFFYFYNYTDTTASGISRSYGNTRKMSRFFPQDNINHFIWWNNSWESFKKKTFSLQTKRKCELLIFLKFLIRTPLAIQIYRNKILISTFLWQISMHLKFECIIMK